MPLFSKPTPKDVHRLAAANDAKRLWKILKRNDPRTRGVAKDALVVMGAPAVPTLVGALAGPDRKYADGTSWHSKAIRVLSLMGQRAVDPLTDLSMKSSDKVVRQVATDCLDKLKVPLRVSAAKSGDETAVLLLIDELRHAVGWSTRLRLAQQLATTGHPSTVVPLRQELENLQRLMSLDPVFYKQVNDGPLNPNLRNEINRFDRLLKCDMNLSPNATISRESDDWVLHDRNRRYLLRKGEEWGYFDKHSGGTSWEDTLLEYMDDPHGWSKSNSLQAVPIHGLRDGWVSVGHKLDIELPQDDERLTAIRRRATPPRPPTPPTRAPTRAPTRRRRAEEMSFTAQDVKALRDSSGAGMMDCKKALEENGGDIEAAKIWLREKGLAASAKREDREASQGVVSLLIDGNVGAIVELKSETDFVAGSDQFKAEADALVALVAAKGVDAVSERTTELEELKVTLKENIGLGAVERIEAAEGNLIGSYQHIQGGRGVNGVLVEIAGGTPELAHDVAVHIAFARPKYLSRDDVPGDVVAAERATLETISRNEGKPEAALPKIVEGRLNGFFKDVALLDQPYAKDDKQSVSQFIGGASIVSFAQGRIPGVVATPD